MNDSMSHLPSEFDLRQLLDGVAHETGVPGIGLVVSLAGRRTSAYTGLAVCDQAEQLGRQSRFEVSCLMKLFVSLVALEMAAQELINLDDPIERYLPELRKAHVPAILVRHLLSHTSGYHGLDISDSRTRWGYSWERFVDYFQLSPPHFPPGSVFNYEHSEHVLLGEILQRVTGTEATQLVQQQILGPLEIRTGCATSDAKLDEGFVAQHRFDDQVRRYLPLSIPAFSKFWSSSLPDMTMTLDGHVALAESLLDAMNLNAPTPRLSAQTLAALQRPAIHVPKMIATGILGERIPTAFSTGCGHYRLGLLGHNGSMSGQACAVRFDPRHGLALAVGINAWAPYARDAVIDRVVALCLGGNPTLRRRNSKRVRFRLEDLLAGYSVATVTGQYEGSYRGHVTVREQDDGLQFDFGDSAKKRGLIAHARRCSDGLYTIESRAPVAVTFFTDPATDGPALMAGVHAYKKVASGEAT